MVIPHRRTKTIIGFFPLEVSQDDRLYTTILLNKTLKKKKKKKFGFPISAILLYLGPFLL